MDKKYYSKLEREIDERKRIERNLKLSEAELIRKNIQLAAALQDIKVVQAGLIQQEKLAGIGKLAAGVAHEINNPLGFITGNIEALEQYFDAINIVLAKYRELLSDVLTANDPQMVENAQRMVQLEIEKDMDHIFSDIPDIFKDTIDGLHRMSKIVKSMRHFCGVTHNQVYEPYDLNMGLKNTLLIVHGEIKHVAYIEENFGQIPQIEALGDEINQVLLNLILNAGQAIRERNNENPGVIKVSTWQEDEYVYCAVEDNGIGIAAENLKNIFNSCITPKPIVQGKGMGLSVSNEIIVNHHQGTITVESCLGEGTKFVVQLPIAK